MTGNSNPIRGAHTARKHAGQQVLESLVPSRAAVGAPADLTIAPEVNQRTPAHFNERPNFFLPYQTRWIKDPSPKRLMVKSRQIGISLATAYDLVTKTGVRASPFDAWVNPKQFSLHTVTMPDAVQQGLLARLKTKWARADPGDHRLHWSGDDFLQSLRHGCPDEETWQQEFLCQPGDDDSAFLTYDLIASCQYQPGEPWEYSNSQFSIPNSQFFVGVDIGRFHDLTVIWVLEKIGDVHATRKIICLQNQPFETQEKCLYELLSLPAVKRACIDQTGLGCQFVERAKRHFPPGRVEGLTFTAPLKEKLAYQLRCAFEDKTIRIPDDRLLSADLRSIRKTVTASGNIRFEGERQKNSHADRFWAACAALEAAATHTTNNIFFAQII